MRRLLGASRTRSRSRARWCASCLALGLAACGGETATLSATEGTVTTTTTGPPGTTDATFPTTSGTTSGPVCAPEALCMSLSPTVVAADDDGVGVLGLEDMNLDGRLDILAMLGDDPRAALILGEGDGTFQAHQWLGFASKCFPRAGDLNHDGRPDLVASCSQEVGQDDILVYHTEVALGNGDGTVQPAEKVLAAKMLHAVADLDLDANLDLLVSNGVLLGLGTGNFGPLKASGLSELAWTVIGDLDNDARPDVVGLRWDPGSVSIALGQGDGTFVEHSSPITGGHPNEVVGQDFNQDGKLDIAVTLANADTVRVLLGDGTGALQPAQTLTLGQGGRSLVAGDLDGDGRVDLASASYFSGDLRVFLGRGDGSFDDALVFLAGGSPRGFAVGDLDGNTRLDFASGNAEEIRVLLAECACGGGGGGGDGGGTGGDATSTGADTTGAGTTGVCTPGDLGCQCDGDVCGEGLACHAGLCVALLRPLPPAEDRFMWQSVQTEFVDDNQVPCTGRVVAAMGDQAMCFLGSGDELKCAGRVFKANWGPTFTGTGIFGAEQVQIRPTSEYSDGNGMCVLVAGEVLCMGRNNDFGVYGTGDSADVPTFTKWGTVSGVARFGTGTFDQLCALDVVGTVHCSGDGFGLTPKQTAIGASQFWIDTFGKLHVDEPAVWRASTGRTECQVGAQGLICTGSANGPAGQVVDGNSLLLESRHCWLRDSGAVQCEEGGQISHHFTLSPVLALASDSYTDAMCAVYNSGALACVGSNTSGKLGSGNQDPLLVETVVQPPGSVHVDCK